MKNYELNAVVKELKEHGIDFPSKINIQVKDSRQVLYETMKYFIGDNFKWIPEYDQVAHWLTDNKGLGLCLYGNNGTGKTVLIQKVIPAILYRYNRKVLKCFNYNELNQSIDSLLPLRMLSIDDVGIENESCVFGNKRWVFSELMDTAEKRNNLIIFSTNFDGKPLQEKYGTRTFERIVSTTKRVRFEHNSFRK